MTLAMFSRRLMVAPAIRTAVHRVQPTFFFSRTFSSFPDYEVLILPALSPTMERGNLARWALEVGDSIEAGTVICEIETDKATVDYEAQDDGYLAKILVPAGSSDLKVGTPIGIVVEEKSDVGAFDAFTENDIEGGIEVESASKPLDEDSAPGPPPASTAPDAASPPAAPVPPPVPEPTTPVAPPAPEPTASVATSPATTTTPTISAPRTSTKTLRASPLAASMTQQRRLYEEKYGMTYTNPVEKAE